ncbi:MAG: phosphonate degradation HD-domain oxygenase [Cyanobacteria bacterium P01_A01_bin.70]
MSPLMASLLQLYRDRGQTQYGGEAVSQLAHALQCATLAEQAGESAALITACLLHDIGHLIHHLGEDAAQRGFDDRHEYRAVPVLEQLWPTAVTTPICLHVAAKRYLCAVDQTYWAALSPASQRSLELQGGVFSTAAAARFIQQPYATDAVKLRRWDDRAKSIDQTTPPLNYFINILETAAAGG